MIVWRLQMARLQFPAAGCGLSLNWYQTSMSYCCLLLQCRTHLLSHSPLHPHPHMSTVPIHLALTQCNVKASGSGSSTLKQSMRQVTPQPCTPTPACFLPWLNKFHVRLLDYIISSTFTSSLIKTSLGQCAWPCSRITSTISCTVLWFSI